MVRTLIVALALVACAGYALSQGDQDNTSQDNSRRQPVETTEAAAATEATAETEAADADSIVETPASRVATLFQGRCVACHGGQKPAANLSLEADQVQQSLPTRESRQLEGFKLIDLETPEKSYLLMKVKDAKGINGGRMPAGGDKLADEDVLIIQEWVVELAAAANDTTARTEAPAGNAEENEASEQNQRP